MFRTRLLALVGVAALALVTGCNTAPKSAADQSQLQSASQQAIATAITADPSLRSVLDTSAGYAVFPDAGQGGLIVGGGYAKGVLYEKNKMVGYCDMSLLSFGAEIGGKSYTEIIAFKSTQALQQFKLGKYQFGGNTSAVALTAGAASSTQFKDDVAVFVTDQSGLMAAAAVGGQSFRYQPRGIVETEGPVQPAGAKMPGDSGNSGTGTGSDVESPQPR